MSRKDIIDAVTDPDSVVILDGKKNKSIVIPNESSFKAEAGKLVQEMDIKPGSLMHIVLRVFCEEKNASAVNAKVLAMRIRNLSDEQLKVIRVLCIKKAFSATNILKAIQSIKRMDGSALLCLRAFIDLAGTGPGPLNQFFNAALPQGSPSEVGRQAYEAEVMAKRMRPDQHSAFYTICSQIQGIRPAEAITILKRARKLKQQHAVILNTFIRKKVKFGDKAIDNSNILSLIKLWLPLPELTSTKNFQRLVRQISRKEKKQDFRFILHAYKAEMAREQSGGLFLSLLRRIFG